MNGANGRYMDYADGRIPLGMVVSGSLSEGVKVRLDDGVSIEDIKVGTFVSLQGQRNRFLGVLTEIALESTDDGITSAPPDMSSPLLAQVLSGTIAYNTVTRRAYADYGRGHDERATAREDYSATLLASIVGF